jgi:hypothetical protein
MSESALQELRDVIQVDVKAGFCNRQEVIDSGIDFLLGDYDVDWIEEHATKITDELLAQHYVEQQSWIAETDCDRLSEAFAELERSGIVARHNFTCCQTCGHSEISYEVEAAEEAGNRVRGYVFYHMQDTESAVRRGYLYLAYGALSGKENESESVAREIVETLMRNGLEPDWNGSIRTRICIRDIKWQWRRLSSNESE